MVVFQCDRCVCEGANGCECECHMTIYDRGRKFDANKLRYDLIPPVPLSSVAKVYTIGAIKYGDRNWESGILWSRIYAALMRHLQAWWIGEEIDKENGQEHLASVVWRALALMEYKRTHPEFDDRPLMDKRT